MLTVVHLNGPINSGKSSVGQALSGLLLDAVFVDGDDHDASDDAPLATGIEAALHRIEAEIARAKDGYLIVAYPLESSSYERLKAVSESRGARFVVLTLAPSVEVALTDRGERKLTPEERARIVEMYEEGYHARPFSDAVLDTAGLSPRQSAEWAAKTVLAVA